ncbi:MAG: class I SAM-dependent methyltransferase [Bdellovibrionales bacterium]|jgi:O-methyltransferase involved in polyketide biosynthesis
MNKKQDKDRSYQGANMFKGVLALYYAYKKIGEKSGYEKLIEAMPDRLIPMAEFFVERMSANSSSVVKIADIKNDPEAYIDAIEKSSAFCKKELDLFKTSSSADYTQEMFEQDASLERSGLSTQYLSRKIVIDRRIRESINNGYTQIVMPACGLDMAAERYAAKYPNVHFYLSDLKDMINERKELEDETFAEKFYGTKQLPANLHFGVVDLEEPNALVKQLTSTPDFNRNNKTLYIFEGASMYLTPESIRQNFRDICQTTRKHEIIMGFAFFVPMKERVLVKGAYDGKSIRKLFEIQKLFFRGDESQPAYKVRSLPAVDQSPDGLVNWPLVIKLHKEHHPESSLTEHELEDSIISYKITGGAHFSLRPRKNKTELKKLRKSLALQ